MYHIIMKLPPVKAKARIEPVRLIVRRVSETRMTSRKGVKSIFQEMLRDRDGRDEPSAFGKLLVGPKICRPCWRSERISQSIPCARNHSVVKNEIHCDSHDLYGLSGLDENGCAIQ